MLQRCKEIDLYIGMQKVKRRVVYDDAMPQYNQYDCKRPKIDDFLIHIALVELVLRALTMEFSRLDDIESHEYLVFN